MALPIRALLNPISDSSSSDGDASPRRNELHAVVNVQAGVQTGQNLQRSHDAGSHITPSPTDSAPSSQDQERGGSDTPRRKRNHVHHDNLPTPPKSDGLQAHREGIEQENVGIQALAAINRARFNIFEALMTRLDLFVEFCTQLELDDLISLYGTSRDFHDHVNSHFTTIIMVQAEKRARESAQVFNFKAYKSFCMPDPAMRPHPRRSEEIRLVPSFRWLRMVIHRERVVTEIIKILADEGLKMPVRASLTLKRIWLTMDIPTNAKRIGLMHNPSFWTDVDLYLAVMLFIRLDMLFNDPTDPFPAVALRQLLIGQRSLTKLWSVLKRTSFNSHIEVARAQLRYFYNPPPHLRNVSIFGVQPSEFSTVARDPTTSMMLLRIDELVLREMSRRELPRDAEMICEMILWGTIDFDELDREEEAENQQGALPDDAADPGSA